MSAALSTRPPQHRRPDHEYEQARGIARDPVLHEVASTAPVVRLGNGRLVRFALCNLATELWPPSASARSWRRCGVCVGRMDD